METAFDNGQKLHLGRSECRYTWGDIRECHPTHFTAPIHVLERIKHNMERLMSITPITARLYVGPGFRV